MTEPQVHNPLTLFLEWFEEAKRSNNFDATACAIATASAKGHPSVRMVLLKNVDELGFVFYTNTDSAKGIELAENPLAALLFHWQNPHRQIRIEGSVSIVNDDEADAYFATRHRTSQIGAWASAQSRPMENKFELERKLVEFKDKFGIGAISRPPNWTGYRIFPARIEFWQEQDFRLHDRIAYTRDGTTWRSQRLFP